MTSKGQAIYPYLNAPDTAFDAAGVYKCQLKMSPEDAKEFADQVKTIASDEFGKDASKVKLPFKNDEETGEVIFTAKSKFPPTLIDADGQIMPEHMAPNITAALR